MKQRTVVLVSGLILLAVIVKGADTNAQPVANTNVAPAPLRTAAQIEKELRAVTDAEVRWLKSLAAGVENSLASLDKHGELDDSWEVSAHTGPPRFSYISALEERRVVLAKELYSKRTLEAGKTIRQPTGARDVVPAAHDP